MQNESTEACDDTGVCCQIHPDAAIRYISMEKLIKHHHRGGGASMSSSQPFFCRVQETSEPQSGNR